MVNLKGESQTYYSISLKTKPIKISKLCLALIELIKVSLFKSYPCMSLINLESKLKKIRH